MKYLSDYMNDKQSALFKETGAFFAFSSEQMKKERVDGVKYASLGVGMICPIDNVDKLIDGIETIQKESIKEDIKDNGVSGIIQRELGNHECQITGDIDNVVEALEPYGIDRDRIMMEWKTFWDKCVKNDWF